MVILNFFVFTTLRIVLSYDSKIISTLNLLTLGLIRHVLLGKTIIMTFFIRIFDIHSIACLLISTFSYFILLDF